MKKNTYAYVMTAILSLLLTVAAAFLMTAADAPIREGGMYLSIFFATVFTGSSAAALLSNWEQRPEPQPAH